MEEIRVRWEGNNSSMYDGKTQDIALKYVVEEDHANIAVGKSVKVKWGRSSQIWKAVVVDTFAQSESEPSPPAAKKAKHQPGRPL